MAKICCSLCLATYNKINLTFQLILVIFLTNQLPGLWVYLSMFYQVHLKYLNNFVISWLSNNIQKICLIPILTFEIYFTHLSFQSTTSMWSKLLKALQYLNELEFSSLPLWHQPHKKNQLSYLKSTLKQILDFKEYCSLISHKYVGHVC